MDRLKEELRLLNYGHKGKMQKDHGEPCSKLPSFQDRAHGQLEQEEEHITTFSIPLWLAAFR